MSGKPVRKSHVRKTLVSGRFSCTLGRSARGHEFAFGPFDNAVIVGARPDRGSVERQAETSTLDLLD